MPDCFTTSGQGLMLQLINQVAIGPAFDSKGTQINPRRLPARMWNALWDTGATASCISDKVATSLGLISTGMKRISGVSGPDVVPTFIVNIGLPNRVCVKEVEVAQARFSSDKGSNFDLLIGMDIITLGDFAVTNYRGKTVFSFRTPSMLNIDFVKKSYLEPIKIGAKPERNLPCPCGSGKKHKDCCGKN